MTLCMGPRSMQFKNQPVRKVSLAYRLSQSSEIRCVAGDLIKRDERCAGSYFQRGWIPAATKASFSAV